MITIETVCPVCGTINYVTVAKADLAKYEADDGMLIQDAFPYLSADEREMLISGICPKCWDMMFSGE